MHLCFCDRNGADSERRAARIGIAAIPGSREFTERSDGNQPGCHR